ncbi:MAG TPA: ABC transporter substrate-binding protein [Candidatus Sulfotelmatobacter sp.]|nr:ABC transporter substrate-binding protein [Candidatus Sulfotelmatobacter sp.]
MHKKLGAISALATLLAGGLVAGPAVAADQPVVVGIEVPLSPPGDPVAGQLIRRGAELAVEYVNTKMGGVMGGKKIAIAVEDSQGRTEGGIAAYRRLVTEEHAVGVTGFFHSSVNIAVNEVANELGVPTIGTQTSAADITAKHYPVAFRTHAIDPIRVAAWLDFIKRNKFKKISLLAETTDYGIGLTEETKKQNEAGHLGLDLQSITFDHAVTDLSAQLLQVKAFKPDLLINIGVGQPMDLMIEQAATLGITPATPMLVSYDAPLRPQFWQLHPKTGDKLYFIAYYSPKQKLSDIGSWFAQAYQAKFKEAPVYSSLNGFGDTMIIAEAVDQAKSTDPKAIIKALETGTFKSWADAKVTFPRADGVYWHNWSPPILILQYTQPNQDWKDASVILEHVGSAP